MSLVCSNGKLGVLNRSYPISVRFASTIKIKFPVKQMNDTHILLDQMPSLSLFEIAGRIETQAASRAAIFATDQSSNPITEIMLKQTTITTKK